jgi:hypothetical protein
VGFKVGRVFELDFTDTDAAGAVVKVRSVSIGRLAEVPDKTTHVQDAEFLAEHLVEWNLEDAGGPVPLTVKGLLSLELPFFWLIYGEWMKATRGVSAPFDRRSSGGGSPPVADEPAPSIPMETL